MQRLISLFREPEELPGLSDRPPPPDLIKPKEQEGAEGLQPLYFVQLLEYLREQRKPIDDAVIGAENN